MGWRTLYVIPWDSIPAYRHGQYNPAALKLLYRGILPFRKYSPSQKAKGRRQAGLYAWNDVSDLLSSRNELKILIGIDLAEEDITEADYPEHDAAIGILFHVPIPGGVSGFPGDDKLNLARLAVIGNPVFGHYVLSGAILENSMVQIHRPLGE